MKKISHIEFYYQFNFVIKIKHISISYYILHFYLSMKNCVLVTMTNSIRDRNILLNIK